ncbi:MAG: triosephosphate isomerase [Candidatus Peribacteria bacterium]|nr:triosephosphate isomerase [Candidatus Peribacteria bacterium]
MPRIPLIAANWKMNPAPESLEDCIDSYIPNEHADVVVFPCLVDIPLCLELGMVTGAQYGRAENYGAFTGDISLQIMSEIGCTWVLCGHSERRRYHLETDADIIKQAEKALELGMQPIVCIGETQEERQAGAEQVVIRRQMSDLPEGITLAYEPVWAIGTGQTATPAQAQDMHAFIRSLLPADARDGTRILYGGSVNGQNAESLLLQPDIDGALVGGAALKPDEFGKIVQAAVRMTERL